MLKEDDNRDIHGNEEKVYEQYYIKREVVKVIEDGL